MIEVINGKTEMEGDLNTLVNEAAMILAGLYSELDGEILLEVRKIIEENTEVYMLVNKGMSMKEALEVVGAKATLGLEDA